MLQPYEIRQLRRSLREMESLRDEVKNNLFIPKRFRKEAFTPELRDEYVSYLERECADLRGRIEGAEKALGNPVQVQKVTVPNATHLH